MSQYNRRSPRAITTVPNPNQYGPSYQGGYQNAPQNRAPPKAEPLQHNFVPQSQNVVVPPPPPTPTIVHEPVNEPSKVSATTKALEAMEEDGEEKPRWKKGVRISKAEKKKRLNRMISRVVAPKSALMLLHEFKPSVTYRFTESSTVPNPSYLAEVLVDNNVLAIGQGSSKAQAKSTAAENALKAIVSQMVKDGQAGRKVPDAQSITAMDTSGEGGEGSSEAGDQLPWTGLAAYAMYRMFNEWQQEGVQVPLPSNEQNPTRRATGKPKPAEELPADAATMHPTVLITQMRPDAIFTEVNRVSGPEGGVTVSAEVEGQLFKATARNRKDARKEVAKLVAKTLYGIQYPA